MGVFWARAVPHTEIQQLSMSFLTTHVLRVDALPHLTAQEIWNLESGIDGDQGF